MNEYITGNVIVITGAFANAAGEADDPSNVYCKVKLPNGTVQDVSSTIVKQSTGNYTANFSPSLVGLHTYEWLGTGAIVAATQVQFYVTATTF